MPSGFPLGPVRAAPIYHGVTKLIRTVSVLVALIAAPLAVVLTASPANAATASPTSVESQIIKLTNKQRTANGCRALRTDRKLVYAARAHSKDMAAKNYFSHTSPDGRTFVTRAKQAGYKSPSAENIAWGYRSAQVVVTGWMNSPGHRKNILTCSSKAVGVGMATKADGTPYYTQDFGRS